MMITCAVHNMCNSTLSISQPTAGRIADLDMTTSTSPNSDQRRPTKETVDVSVLREIARNSLVHALNSVSLFLRFLDV